MREKRYRKPRRLPMFSEPQAAANYAVASALPGLIPTVSTATAPLRTRAARVVPATPAIPGLVKGVRAGYDGGKFYSETPFQAADAFWQARPRVSREVHACSARRDVAHALAICHARVWQSLEAWRSEM